MQAWAFPGTLKTAHKQTAMMKDTTLSQALNNRLADDPVFFVYDHNMLKKEEDDLKDAILYFTPEFMSGDDQCALCGQLMGMMEFLGVSISQSTPAFFKFDQEKFALKQIGSYSFGLQASVLVPDSVMSEQLMSLYEVFVTFHGSIDSVRLRFKDNHGQFLKEFGAIWRLILQVSKLSLHTTLYQTFNHVPCVHLPQSGSHLFLQASHLLQASQRRPFVLAGAIFYKNKVLCTQLSPALTRHLTFLQNQIPYIARNTDSDMPKGCKIITIFLTDDELKQITPVHLNTSRHCKSTNFNQPVKKKSNMTEPKPTRKLTRRQTCSSVPTFHKENSSKSPVNVSEQTIKKYVTTEQLKSFRGRQDAMRIEQSTWGKNKSKVHLSHVPLVECRSGESLFEESLPGKSLSIGKVDKVAKSLQTNDGQTYQQLELRQHLDSLTFGESGEPSDLTISTDGHGKESVHTVPSDASLENTELPRNDLRTNNTDIYKSDDGIKHSEKGSTRDTELQEADNPDSVIDVKNIEILNIKDTEDKDRNRLEDQNGKNAVSLHSLSTIEFSETDTLVCDESNEMVVDNKVIEPSDSNPENKVCVTRSELADGAIEPEPDNSSMEVDLQVKEKHNMARITELEQDHLFVKADAQRLVSESDISETEDEMEVVADSFIPCIACLDLNVQNPGTSEKKCKKCERQPSVKEVIGKTGERQEILDFGKKVVVNDSDYDEVETQSDIEGRHFYSAKSEGSLEKAAVSSFSSDVSTDSTISRYWTYEMEGLNDVTLYVQCHSEISLLLIMENPEQYEENLFHALWKGSLAHLADLDYYITECIEQEESSDHGLNYRYARFDAFSSELHTNIEDVAVKRRATHLPQMLGVIHSDFKDRPCLTDVTLRSQSSCCYGHHSEGDETYFQPELTNRPVSGLPISRDPVSNLDVVAKQRLSEDKKMTLL